MDIPSLAADFINSSGKLYSCCRRYKRIGLSGFRVFDPSGRAGYKKSTFDKFLLNKRRDQDPNITLLDWAKKCDCPKRSSCGKDHVPVLCCQRLWTWQTGEDFSKELLMKFSPGSWESVEDLQK